MLFCHFCTFQLLCYCCHFSPVAHTPSPPKSLIFLFSFLCNLPFFHSFVPWPSYGHDSGFLVSKKRKSEPENDWRKEFDSRVFREKGRKEVLWEGGEAEIVDQNRHDWAICWEEANEIHTYTHHTHIHAYTHTWLKITTATRWSLPDTTPLFLLSAPLLHRLTSPLPSSNNMPTGDETRSSEHWSVWLSSEPVLSSWFCLLHRVFLHSNICGLSPPNSFLRRVSLNTDYEALALSKHIEYSGVLQTPANTKIRYCNPAFAVSFLPCSDLSYTVCSSVCGCVVLYFYMCKQSLLSWIILSSPLRLFPPLIVSGPKRCPLSFSCLTFNRFINAPHPLARAGHFILLEISIWLSGRGSALYMLMRR